MASLLSRHPRYVLLSAFLLLSTLLLLASQHAPPPLYNSDLPHRPPPSHSQSQSQSQSRPSILSLRLAAAERAYQSILRQRSALIARFASPSPSNPSPDSPASPGSPAAAAASIPMFPPDHDPWPPYTVWDFFPPAFNCPHSVTRIGALGDGGKWLCGIERIAHRPACTIYSIGINHESSFEAQLLASTDHCEVFGYDFSVDEWGPEVRALPPKTRERAHFKPYGVGGSDGYAPGGLHPMYTLQTLMRLNNHTFIDVLKIDIESWEFDTIT